MYKFNFLFLFNIYHLENKLYAGIPQGEVQYYAPGQQAKVDSFFDSITITRDGGSLDEIKVRFKNAGGPTGCAIFISY